MNNISNDSFSTAETPAGDRDDLNIETPVVGIFYEGRQADVKQVSLGEKVYLRREPQNKHDFNAIRVERSNGRQLGYLNRVLAASLAYRFDAYGQPVCAEVIAVTGGLIIRFEPPGSVD